MRLITAAILFMSAIMLCRGEAHYSRLRRPERLENAEQLSNYLKELQDYYMVHGRGRYGKRQMHIADASIIFRETPIFEDDLNGNSLWNKLTNFN